VKQLINDITAQLLPCYPEDEARSLAWWIVEEETGLSRSQILSGCKITKNFAHVQEVIDRLLHFEPIQYIFGHTEWCGLDLKVTPATLIPRPETAELVERINQQSAISNQQSAIRVLDVGTGSGCIAIALKKAHPEWQVTGIDISSEAIEVARENAARNGVEVTFQVADIFSDEMTKYLNKWCMVNDQMVNIVVSNPPYITESEKSSMRPNVLDFEPHTALFVPDSDPLRFYRRIAELLKNHQSSHLFFEINEAFGEEMKNLFADLGYTDIHITNDIYGKARIIEGRMVG
jgi:release factor glutamine methyltransferase